MKVLVLGATGMLGYSVFHVFNKLGYNVYGTTRSLKFMDLFPPHKIICNMDIYNKQFLHIVKGVVPNVIINCIGVTKHIVADNSSMIYANSYFSHEMSELATKLNARYVYISTDCIFSGRDGNYSEYSISDCCDIYGKSKLLGEVVDGNHLTIRTSFIGRELSSSRGLLEWFLLQKGTAQGYTKAIWNGLTTPEIARILEQMINKQCHGIYHVGGEIIDKCSLLSMIKSIFYKHDVEIIPNDTIKIDRSLNIDKYRELGIQSPPLEILIEELQNG